MSSARFLVTKDELARSALELRGNEFRHLRVRRLAPGAEVIVTDGAGGERRGTVLKVTREHAEIRLHEVRSGAAPETRLHLELAQAALKTDKLDLVIEKATEIGVSGVTVFTSLRCVSRPPAARLERWERVARSAAKQSQRREVPQVRGPIPFDELLSEGSSGLKLLFWEGAAAIRLEAGELPQHPGEILAVIGPEGGFDPTEIVAARAAGLRVLGMGPRILRAETAAIVAVTLCQRLWGDL